MIFHSVKRHLTPQRPLNRQMPSFIRKHSESIELWMFLAMSNRNLGQDPFSHENGTGKRELDCPTDVSSRGMGHKHFYHCGNLYNRESRM